MTEDFDNTAEAIRRLQELQSGRLSVGVPWLNNHLNMIAMVQEYGKTIVPVNRQWLALPTPNSGDKRPADFQNLFFMLGKNADQAYLAMPDANSGFKIMFILRKSVVIPPRPFLRYSFNHHLDRWTELGADLVFKCMIGEIEPKDVYSVLGEAMVKDIKQTITDFSTPSNAPLTAKNKGFNDPLIDSGELRDSITWITERI